MSNATNRREKKLAIELQKLAVSNPARFKLEWETMLCYWTMEAIRRGRLLQKEPASGVSLSLKLPVFGVLKKAERLLALCGTEAERLVGSRTRDLLSNDCAKAVALAVDKNLYHLNVKLCKPKLKQRSKATLPIPNSTQGD